MVKDRPTFFSATRPSDQGLLIVLVLVVVVEALSFYAVQVLEVCSKVTKIFLL